ncbi:MAG: hypothetical protein L6Q37_00610 [Bdellovibrionaceae bacterium]|nr:hypothetical protein [Pseudobdellovibrionaceae bacterium]
MANHEGLSQWVLSSAKDLNLRVTKLDWIDRYYKGYSDIEAKIQIDLKMYSGRGSDFDSTTALMKTVTESIERFVCHANKISSIGVAGHYNLEIAKENALLEFFERSIIWSHFHKKIGMKCVSTESISMNAPDGYFGVFTLAEGLESGFEIGGIMGASVARDLDKALKKSSIECLRNVSALANYSHESLSYEQFKKIQKPSSEDSQNLLFNKSYCQELLDIVSKENIGEMPTALGIGQLIFEELPYSALVLKDCPLRFVRCLDQNRNPAPDTEFVG